MKAEIEWIDTRKEIPAIGQEVLVSAKNGKEKWTQPARIDRIIAGVPIWIDCDFPSAPVNGAVYAFAHYPEPMDFEEDFTDVR